VGLQVLGGGAMDLPSVERMILRAQGPPPVMTLLPKVILRRGLALIYSIPSARGSFLELLSLDSHGGETA
jgi:hypothetical protein